MSSAPCAARDIPWKLKLNPSDRRSRRVARLPGGPFVYLAPLAPYESRHQAPKANLERICFLQTDAHKNSIKSLLQSRGAAKRTKVFEHLFVQSALGRMLADEFIETRDRF